MKSVADDPVAISYKTQSLADFVSEPLKSVLTKALDDFESGENGAFSTAQKEAASLQSQFIAMPRQFSGDNDGQKCYTGEKGGAGSGSFSCPQRKNTCPIKYEYKTSTNNGQLAWRVTNPRYRMITTKCCKIWDRLL